MAPRESFKIDKNDPDLKTFELYIAELHPEFRALRQNRQPSYEHPDFCKRTLEFSCLPGSDDPYDLLALNLFSKDDVYKYLNNVVCKLKESFSKQNEIDIKLQQLEYSLKSVKYEGIIRDGTVTGNEELSYILDYAYSIVDMWLGENLPTSKNLDKNIIITSDELNKIKGKTEEVVQALHLLSDAEFIDSFFNNKSEHRSKKYAVLSYVFFIEYIYGLEKYVNNYFNEFVYQMGDKLICYDRGYLCNTGIPNSVRVYPALILAYELVRNRLKMKDFKSPSTFINIELHGGINGSNFKKSYRCLFIKAWLYSYLKNKKISQTDMAKIIALDNRFYPDESFVILKDFEPSMDGREDEYIIYRRRHKKLTNMFSEWNNCKNEQGYISSDLFSKGVSGYKRVMNEKNKKKQQE
ncbi:hypothetical protein IHC88_12985 [Photobacterium damselae subsp. damselae]|uniref:hypothetical protein n=2 Tax=Photobacterium damselae TaxID=38293 RepID=UPI001F1BFCF4|nr:hypothetical protein [Photobacterium damselae]UJZ97523.1 hypothetical protein IHC88_12985 [Photobacterium damselae subsp. damselae]